MKIIFSKRCFDYEFPGHPESPQRLKSIYNLLKEKEWEFIEPEPAKEEDILRIHSSDLVEKVKNGEFLDPDTPNSKKMFEYALLSCGAAIKAQELALNNKTAFSLVRPPGHHATRYSAGGFCYFNNIAVAISKALDTVKKAAIIDIDCHHGNGTQDIFLGDERVLYISLHQSPLYPGTGLKSIKNCLNFPLPAGTDEEEYLNIFKKAIEEAKNFQPELIAVSAGFDTYKNDPLTNFNLEKKTFAKISSLISSLKKPAFSVLEGGYRVLELAECVEQYLIGWD
jgi:acetoin utilization deacetylase AcuC-like enzyme